MQKRIEIKKLIETYEHRFSNGAFAETDKGLSYLKVANETPHSILQSQNEDLFYSAVSNLPNILPRQGFAEISDKKYIVYPYVKMDLVDLLQKVSLEDLRQFILIPLLKSLHHMHGLDFVHGDLKLENVRVSQEENQLKVYLADFGKAVQMGTHIPNRISSLPQHLPPDMTIGPQLDIYSLGVLTYQMLFGFDFIKNYQMAGRDFKKIPEAEKVDKNILEFIARATAPSALDRFQSANQALDFLLGNVASTEIQIEKYDLSRCFEFYLESMKSTFLASHRTLKEFEDFVGPWGKKYYQRLQRWMSSAFIAHLKVGDEIVGICEASLKGQQEGMISTIFIVPHFRRKGGAQKLEEAALNFMKSQSRKRVFLNVSIQNVDAIAFYRRTGWVDSGTQDYAGALQLVKQISE